MRRFCIILVAIAVVLAGCTNKQQTSGAQPSTSPTTAAAATSTTTAVAFTDISGYDGAQAIEDLAALGVLDSASGEFKPNDPITRAEFVRWLVKAQNAIIQDSQYHIHLAQPGSKATFLDVPSSYPDFGYIQGVANSGYVIGVDLTHFAPDKSLTREQMIFIKACVDERSDIKTTGGAIDVVRGKYSDYSKIVPKYVGAIYEDMSAMTTKTFGRVYGSTKQFEPQQPVTRGEAAVALSYMRGEWVRSAAEALGRTAPPQ